MMKARTIATVTQAGRIKGKKKGNAFNRMVGFFVKALQGSGADLDW